MANEEKRDLSNPVEALSPFPSERNATASQQVIRTTHTPGRSDADDPIVFESVRPCPLPIVPESVEPPAPTRSPAMLWLEQSLDVWQRRLSDTAIRPGRVEAVRRGRVGPFAIGVLCGIVGVYALSSGRSATPIAPSPQVSQNAIVTAALKDVALPEELGDSTPAAVPLRAATEERTTSQPPSQRPRPRRAVSAPRFRGHLIIDSEPRGASVMINQRVVGITPLELSRFPASSYAVRVQQDGYERWSAGVLVPADKVTRVHAQLQRRQ